MPIRMAVVSEQIPASGDLTFARQGFGTPVAALFITTPTTIDGDVSSSDANMSIGATDFTRHWVVATHTLHGQSTSGGHSKRGATDEVCMTIDRNGNIEMEANYKELADNGLTIEFGVRAHVGAWITCIMFAGGWLEAYCGQIDNTGGNENITAPGFQPTEIFMASNHVAIDDSANTTECQLSFGMVNNDIDGGGIFQVSSNWGWVWSGGNTLAYLHANSSQAMSKIAYGGGSVSGGISVTTLDADGFTAEQVSGGGTLAGYLALRVQGPDGEADTFSEVSTYTLNTTIEVKEYGKGTTETGAWIVLPTHANVTTLLTGYRAGPFAIGASAIDVNLNVAESCHSMTNRNNTATTVANNLKSSVMVNSHNHVDAVELYGGHKYNASGNVYFDFMRASTETKQWPTMTFQKELSHDFIGRRAFAIDYNANNEAFHRFQVFYTYNGTAYDEWTDLFEYSEAAGDVTVTHTDTSTDLETVTGTSFTLSGFTLYKHAVESNVILVHDSTKTKVGEWAV